MPASEHRDTHSRGQMHANGSHVPNARSSARNCPIGHTATRVERSPTCVHGARYDDVEAGGVVHPGALHVPVCEVREVECLAVTRQRRQHRAHHHHHHNHTRCKSEGGRTQGGATPRQATTRSQGKMAGCKKPSANADTGREGKTKQGESTARVPTQTNALPAAATEQARTSGHEDLHDHLFLQVDAGHGDDDEAEDGDVKADGALTRAPLTRVGAVEGGGQLGGEGRAKHGGVRPQQAVPAGRTNTHAHTHNTQSEHTGKYTRRTHTRKQQ